MKKGLASWIFSLLSAMVLILAWGLAAVYLVCDEDNRRYQPAPATNYPYYFVNHLEDASSVDTPVPGLLTAGRKKKPLYLCQEAFEAARASLSLRISPQGGRRGGGILKVINPDEATGTARARVSLGLERGGHCLLTGYVRYLCPRDPGEMIKLNPTIPEAAISWIDLAEPRPDPVYDFEAPASLEKLAGKSLHNRTPELLEVAQTWKATGCLGDWKMFSLPVVLPRDCKALRLAFECKLPLGEIQFSDMTLIPQDFTERMLWDGAYRFLPSTEFTYPLKKMIRLGATYRESLLALPDTVYEFDLDMPARPVLEFALGLITEAGCEDPGEVEFRITYSNLRLSESPVLFSHTLRSGAEKNAWHPVSLPLDDLAGKQVTLRLETRSKNPVQDRAHLAPLWGTPVIYNREQPESRPNLLLLTLDCTREDRLGIHGHHRNCTPYLDSLAGESVDFLNAYTPCDYTYLVMPMLMTGRMIQFDWLGSFNVMDQDILSLAEILKGEGYLVGGFCADYYYNGFWKGFPFRQHMDRIHPIDQDEMLLDQARDFMLAHPDTPVFTWVHITGAHPPCYGRPPGRIFMEKEGLEDEMAALREAVGLTPKQPDWDAIDKILIMSRRKGNPTFPEEVKARAAKVADAMYDGELLATDGRVRDFLEPLKQAGLWEKTLLVLSSDHGIQLTKENMVLRGPEEVGIRVPLILHGPGLSDPPRSIKERVSTISLLPTLLERLKITAPQGLTGKSLLPLCRGEADALDEPGVLAEPSALAESGVLAEPGAFTEPLLFIGFNNRVVLFDEFKYVTTKAGLKALLAPDADLEGPPLDWESLHDISPSGPGDGQDLKTTHNDQLIQGRRYLVEGWKSLLLPQASGPVNTALIQFFQKAGYMK